MTLKLKTGALLWRLSDWATRWAVRLDPPQPTPYSSFKEQMLDYYLNPREPKDFARRLFRNQNEP